MLLASFQGEGVNERVNEQTRRTFKRFSTSKLQNIFVIRSLGIFRIRHSFVLPWKLACSEVLVRRARKCLTPLALNMKAASFGKSTKNEGILSDYNSMLTKFFNRLSDRPSSPTRNSTVTRRCRHRGVGAAGGTQLLLSTVAPATRRCPIF